MKIWTYKHIINDKGEALAEEVTDEEYERREEAKSKVLTTLRDLRANKVKKWSHGRVTV